MNYNFDWNYIASGAPYVTISNYALSFNAATSSLLGNPEKVLLGFDSTQKVIGVTPYRGDSATKSFIFYSRMKNGWIRIGCKDFIRQLSSLTGLSFNPAKKYVANYDSKMEILYFSVTNSSVEKENELLQKCESS